VLPAHVRPRDLAMWAGGVGAMRNCDGIVVTVPHKFAALALCGSVTPRAASIGAVNAIRRDADGAWFGDMCDGVAYVSALRNAGCNPSGKRTLLVGAGGAGSAIGHALVDAGVAALAIHDADPARRDALMTRLRSYGALVPSPGSADPSGFDLAINATPMGMQAQDPLPLNTDRLTPDTFVGDVVTLPASLPTSLPDSLANSLSNFTALILAARARGCATLTGIGMFEAVRAQLVDFYLGPP
jgi:shikimate dehydrogenase